MTTNTSQPARRRWWKSAAMAALLVVVLVALYPVGRYAWASWHFHSATNALKRRDYDSARRHSDVCLSEWPNSGDVYFVAARTARRAGDLGEAQRLLREAQRIGYEPDQLELERGLLTAQSGQYHSVFRGLWALVQRQHPDSILILETLAPVLIQDLEVSTARQCLDTWIQLEPDYARPRMLKALMQERMQNSEDALNEYREAIRLDPSLVEARLKGARLMLTNNHLDEAQTHYEWLKQRLPDDPSVQRGLAECYMLKGHTDEARRLLTELVEQNPNDGASRAVLGRLELQSGEPATAETHLRRACALMPHEPELFHNLALALEQQGQTAEAAAVRDRSERIRRDMHETGKLMTAAVNNPRDIEPRRQIAIRMLRHGLEGEARRWLESALRIDPRHAPTHETFADYYMIFGDRARAEEHRRIARANQER